MAYIGKTVDYLLHLGAGEGLFRRAEELRKKMTEAEKILWKELRDRRLMDMKFRRQHPLHYYIADFYCHELRLAIEVDGGIHENEEMKDRDANRDAELERLGVTVLRFTNEEVIERTENVREEINTVMRKLNAPHLAGCTSTPCPPSPQGEGGKTLTPLLEERGRGEVEERAPHPPTPSPQGEGESGIPPLSFRRVYPAERREGRGEVDSRGEVPTSSIRKSKIKSRNLTVKQFIKTFTS